MVILKDSDLEQLEMVFWDNDALKMAASKELILEKLSEAMPKASFILSTPVYTEFLAGAKDMYSLQKKRHFLENYHKYFIKYTFDKATTELAGERVVGLQRVYSGLKFPGTPSYVDLLLQAYSIVFGKQCAIITKSLGDFNSKVIEPIGLLDIDLPSSEATRQQLYIVRVNKEKLLEAKEEYLALEKSVNERIKREEE